MSDDKSAVQQSDTERVMQECNSAAGENVLQADIKAESRKLMQDFSLITAMSMWYISAIV